MDGATSAVCTHCLGPGHWFFLPIEATVVVLFKLFPAPLGVCLPPETFAFFAFNLLDLVLTAYVKVNF